MNHEIDTKYAAQFYDLTDEYGKPRNQNIRIYKYSPCQIHLQLRAFTPIKKGGQSKGLKQRHMMAGVNLSAEQTREVIRALQSELQRIEDDTDTANQQELAGRLLSA